MSIKEEFEELYQKWFAETCVHSNSAFIYGNENFKKIETLGKEVVPYIIEKLENNEGVFLTKILDDLYPGIVECTGYVNPVDYVKGWVTAYNFMKLNDKEMETKNLRELLANHIGEKFWNPMLGYIELHSVDNGLLTFYGAGGCFDIAPDGTDMDGNLCVFPARENRDWNVYFQQKND